MRYIASANAFDNLFGVQGDLIAQFDTRAFGQCEVNLKQPLILARDKFRLQLAGDISGSTQNEQHDDEQDGFAVQNTIEKTIVFIRPNSRFVRGIQPSKNARCQHRNRRHCHN